MMIQTGRMAISENPAENLEKTTEARSGDDGGTGVRINEGTRAESDDTIAIVVGVQTGDGTGE